MLRAPICFALFGLFVSAAALPAPCLARTAASQKPPSTASQETMFEVTLPGGVRAALAALDDGASPDRSQFLLECIRRFHNRPAGPENDALSTLVAHLERVGGRGPASVSETLPLPLSPAMWIDVVFRGEAAPETLARAILQTRGAALLYYGLLSVDDQTRAWIATERELIRELASDLSPAFVLAAPALRVAGGAVRIPGGEPARAVWEALTGSPVTEPARFVRALLARNDGRLAYFYGALAPLTAQQVSVVLGLEAGPADRIAAARRVLAIFEQLGWDWKVGARTFWRPALDPALLVAELPVDVRGRPVLPATSAFWGLVFTAPKDPRAAIAEGEARASLVGSPVDFAWLCEQVFNGAPAGQAARYQLVLFASRLLPQVTPGTAVDAIETIRAAAAYPALISALERARLKDVRAFADAARRATHLSAIGNRTRAARALAQFQGALAIVTRAASRGSLPADSLARTVSSLSAVDISSRGEYEGRLVRWMDAHLRDLPGDSTAAGAAADEHLVRALAGGRPHEPQFVDWEGTRYRLDLAQAEALRLGRMLGPGARPYVASALALVAMADALEAGVDLERLTGMATDVERLAGLVGWTNRPPAAVAALRRSAAQRDIRRAAGLAPDLRVVADDLLALGLVKLVYAAGLGEPERISISAGEAAARHDFGLQSSARRTNPWQLPVDRNDTLHGWRVTGSLLGLDVRLAEFSLRHLSSRPPARRPTLNEHDRRVLIEVVALIDATVLSDADRDTLATAMAAGRARLAAADTPRAAVALGEEIRLSPARLSLLPWVMAHERERLHLFFSPSELFWLGLRGRPVDPGLHAWGAPGRPRLGCLCLQLTDRRPWETFLGRWNSGIFASGFPDLNLRLSELLAELQMPAPLLGPVLAAATLDLVNTARSADQDDRRGLIEFVHGLRVERVEEYLALLTTDGPLVPAGEAAASGDSAGRETVMTR